jgi:nicotinamide mononucleotide transporter
MSLSILSWLEIVGAFTGFGYLFFVVKGRRIAWLFYFVSCLAYVPVMIDQEMPLYAATQIFFAITALYGFWVWGSEPSEFRVRKLGSKKFLVLSACFGVTLVCWRLFGAWLSLTGLIDAYLTAASIVATLLTAKRYLSSWNYWLAVNIVGALAYSDRGLYLTALLFLVNLIFSILGFKSWQRVTSSSSI